MHVNDYRKRRDMRYDYERTEQRCFISDQQFVLAYTYLHIK